LRASAFRFEADSAGEIGGFRGVRAQNAAHAGKGQRAGVTRHSAIALTASSLTRVSRAQTTSSVHCPHSSPFVAGTRSGSEQPCSRVAGIGGQAEYTTSLGAQAVRDRLIAPSASIRIGTVDLLSRGGGARALRADRRELLLSL
jgi:uncharacterized protein (UPF0254 family)